MHLGLIVPDLSHDNGWAQYSLSLSRALHRAGIHLTIVSGDETAPVEGVPFEPVLTTLTPHQRFTVPRMLLRTPQVRAILKNCDLIHTTAEPYAPLGNWIAGDRPFVLTGHGSYVQISKLHRWPVSALYRRAFYRAQVVCVSHYTARIAGETLPDVRTVVINNGVDVERFASLPALETGKRGPTILSVGGVKRRKGTLELVRAMAIVRQHIPDAQCMILGSLTAETRYVARVRAEIAQLGLEDWVHLVDFVPEETLLGWYGTADVFVLPSINVGLSFEGFGLVHLEASAAGLPVIGTSGCGVEDAVDDGVTGLLLPQDQLEEQLPQAILDVLTDPPRAARMGAAGREKARHQTWDHVAQEMIALYESLLEGQR
jgi:glycosyltransferase involved in cell wall biosynthesis